MTPSSPEDPQREARTALWKRIVEAMAPAHGVSLETRFFLADQVFPLVNAQAERILQYGAYGDRDAVEALSAATSEVDRLTAEAATVWAELNALAKEGRPDASVEDLLIAVGGDLKFHRSEVGRLTAEVERLRRSHAEEAIRANRASEAHQRALRDRDGQRMSSDRAHAELCRVRQALGSGSGGADLGLQVRDVVAERDSLRAQLDKAMDLSRRLLMMFTTGEKGHPGRPCVRTRWVDESRVAKLHEELAALALDELSSQGGDYLGSGQEWTRLVESAPDGHKAYYSVGNGMRCGCGKRVNNCHIYRDHLREIQPQDAAVAARSEATPKFKEQAETLNSGAEIQGNLDEGRPSGSRAAEPQPDFSPGEITQEADRG